MWRKRGAVPTVSEQGDERVEEGPLHLLVSVGGGAEEGDEECLMGMGEWGIVGDEGGEGEGLEERGLSRELRKFWAKGVE